MQTGLTIAADVVSLIVVIAAVQVAIWVPIIMWWRRKSRVADDQVAAQLKSETTLRAPEKANYRGSTAPRYPSVKNNGVLALSAQQLIFRTLTGKVIEIPVSEITGVRESNVFKGSVTGGATHLIVAIRSGEIGFYVKDNAGWIHAINAAREQHGQPNSLPHISIHYDGGTIHDHGGTNGSGPAV